MTAGLRIVLLLFAVVGFIGTGASLAVARQRFVNDRESDLGMLAVAAMLFVFAALCTVVAGGLVGVVAFGSVIVWAAYVATAQRIGLFRIEVSRFQEPSLGSRQRT